MSGPSIRHGPTWPTWTGIHLCCVRRALSTQVSPSPRRAERPATLISGYSDCCKPVRGKQRRAFPKEAQQCSTSGPAGPRIRRARSSFCCTLAALALAPTGAAAQDPRGTIQGRVVDASGAAIPGATVDVLNIATGVVTPTTTNEQGSYRSAFLNPGTYRVTVSLTGFSKFISDNIELHVSDLLTVDATLKVGAITDEVTVTADGGDGRPHDRRARAGRRRAPDRRAADSRRQPRRARHPGAGRDGRHRPALAQGRLQQRPVAVLDRRRRREEERLHDRRRVQRRQRSRRLQPAVGVGRGVQDPHDVVRRGDRQHDGRGR